MIFDIPKQMRAIAIENPGKKTGTLALIDTAVPTPKPHEILIRVAYAGVNRADLFQREGSYPPPEDASPLPGLEVSGVIVAIGEKVSEWKVGDKVCALLTGGGYAEYATAHEGHALPIPDGWSMAEAAALPEAIFTVWMSVIKEGELKHGENFLVHGAASGIGMMSIFVAKFFGAKIFATARSDKKCAVCLEWGADVAINTTQKNFADEILQKTRKTGVNMLLDMVGENYLADNFRVLAQGGRMVSIAFLSGAKIHDVSAAPLLLKRLTWKGITLRARSDEEKISYAREIRNTLWQPLCSKFIRVHIDKVFEMRDAIRAHEHVDKNLNVGKIIIRIGT